MPREMTSPKRWNLTREKINIFTGRLNLKEEKDLTVLNEDYPRVEKTSLRILAIAPPRTLHPRLRPLKESPQCSDSAFRLRIPNFYLETRPN